MREYSNNDIYVWTQARYKNNLIPILPSIITGYLIDNPCKIDYYFNKGKGLNDLLDYLSKRFKENQTINLLEEIINYIEDPNETRI
mgnify:FL=1